MACNPNSLANLKPITSSEMARELGRKGGNAKKAKKKLRPLFIDALNEALTPDDQAEILKSLVRYAKRGRIDAIKLVLEILHETPAQQVKIEGNMRMDNPLAGLTTEELRQMIQEDGQTDHTSG